MVETTRLEVGSAESTNSFRGKPQKPDLVTSFFLLSCSQQPFMSNCSQEIKIILWCQRSCSTVADIREARTTFGKAHFVLTNMSACQNLLGNVLLFTRNSEKRRKKLCTNIKKLSYRKKTPSVRSDGFWRLSSPRSPELLPDQWPPSSRHQARKWERDT